jgi:hypothetical protein
VTIEQALAWADQTMNERLREARRTGNDHDYDAAMEGCIDILAAEVRRYQAMRCSGCARANEPGDSAYRCRYMGWAIWPSFGCLAWEKRDD